MNDINFQSIRISSWKQFENIDIDFHRNLTILTGANGSGKTTILNLLSRHFGWSYVELATPVKDKNSGGFGYISREWSKRRLINMNFHSPIGMHNNQQQVDYIGDLIYSNGAKADLSLPGQDYVGAQYHININNIQSVKGIGISSHRQIFKYQQVVSIHTARRTKDEAYRLVFQSNMNRYNGNVNSNIPPNSFYIKETLISWAIGGSSNEFITGDEELKKYYLGFQEVLKKVLPKTLGFREFSIVNYEILLITDTGNFILDGASGGISAIIDLSWQIYNVAQLNDDYITVIIDEVENHLHATMQRSLLPDLILAFPNVQFIVSTHSPLIIGSVKESYVYALRYNANRKIYSQKLDLLEKAKSANEILDEVLGVPFTMPIWVENELNVIVDKYIQSDMDENSFVNMREELKHVGLEEFMPMAMYKVIDSNNKY